MAEKAGREKSKAEKRYCEFYPVRVEEGPVCGGGSDISGGICTVEDSELCPWHREEKKRRKEEEIILKKKREEAEERRDEIRQLFTEIEEKADSVCDHWEKGALSNWVKALIEKTGDPLGFEICRKQEIYRSLNNNRYTVFTKYWAELKE